MESVPLHLDKNLPSDSTTINWPISRKGLRSQLKSPPSARDSSSDSNVGSKPHLEPTSWANYPNGRKSLSGVSLRAFLLGVTLGTTSMFTLLLLALDNRLWRPPYFLSALSLFHFLEYYLTASYNTPAANINAFLLSQNGRAYNTAHSVAFLECFTTSYLFPSWQSHISNKYTIAIGLALMIIGQSTRSAAMARAGENFNHTVQTKHNEGHMLVTTGIYAWLRHPSYFGFFYWGIGTQVVIGNLLCLLAYTTTLWAFFQSRISKEEELLITFFGDEYVRYREKTKVWIPFIK